METTVPRAAMLSGEGGTAGSGFFSSFFSAGLAATDPVMATSPAPILLSRLALAAGPPG